MDNSNIILYTNGQFEWSSIHEIADDIRIEFQSDVQIKEGHLKELKGFYDEVRRQYDANKLLKEIESIDSETSTKKIGLFTVDLFIPILTYIFGQSFYQGNSGVVSLYRLRNEQYGMKPDQQLTYNRFKKVIIHEIGHTFGLIHCHVPVCVMRSSTYVEDIDQKKKYFCSQCRTKLFG